MAKRKSKDTDTSTTNTAGAASAPDSKPAKVKRAVVHRKPLTPEEEAVKKAKYLRTHPAFTVGLVQRLAAGKPDTYYDSSAKNTGLGLRVGASRKATWFVRFQHNGQEYNAAIGSLPGTPTKGKALPPMGLILAREEALKHRNRIENPAQVEEVITLRAAFTEYVEHKEVKRNDTSEPLSERSRRGYYDPFERHCAHIADRDYTTFTWRDWGIIWNEAITGERDGKEILYKPRPDGSIVMTRNDDGDLVPKALGGSRDQARVLFAALSGMYNRNDITPNPIVQLRKRVGFGKPALRKNSVLIPELPLFFSALRSLRSPVAAPFNLITLLTGFRRTAILQMRRSALDCTALTYSALPTMVGWKRAPAMVYPLCPWLVQHVLQPLQNSYMPGRYLFPIRKGRKPPPGAPPRKVKEDDERSPALVGCINSLQRKFGRRMVPDDVRRTFVSMGGWLGIPSMLIAKITGHAVKAETEQERKSVGVHTINTRYMQIDAPAIMFAVQDITSAILQCAGEMPLDELIRAKLAREYPDHLAHLETLAVNAGSNRRAAQLSLELEHAA
jgi:integrase